MTEAALPVTTWTHFRVSESHKLDYLEDDSEVGIKLSSAIRSIFSAPGHHRSAWGRVQSDPQLVVLFSIWESRDAFTNFNLSQASRELTSRFSYLTSPPSLISTTVVSFGHQFTRITLQDHTQIRYVYFPSPVSDESRTEINNIKRLVYPYGVGISGQSEIAKDMAYYRPPAQAWADNTVQREGQECEVLVCILFWKSGEMESRFLETVKLMETTPGEKPGTSVLVGMAPVREDWEKKLMRNGAVGWEDEYVDFEMIRADVQQDG